MTGMYHAYKWPIITVLIQRDAVRTVCQSAAWCYKYTTVSTSASLPNCARRLPYHHYGPVTDCCVCRCSNLATLEHTAGVDMPRHAESLVARICHTWRCLQASARSNAA